MSAAVWVEASGWQREAEVRSARYDVTPVLAMLLSTVSRSEEETSAFLAPESLEWPDPFRLPSAAEAADRIVQALQRGETILVHGDYDVDGLMGTAVLLGGLRAWGGKVEAFVPSRFEGGYGLSEASVEAVRKAHARLVLTTDCGINAQEIGKLLEREGVDLIVTDHHLPAFGEQPPGIIVNPKTVEGHPDRELCGAAVALQVLRAVSATLGRPLVLEPFLRLVAIATVADVVPMTPVNRKLCKAGFAALESTPNPGLGLLLEEIRKTGPIRGHHISYNLAPRFNAAGRMEDARLVLDLLLERDPAEAFRLKARIETLNGQRKALQLAAFDEALEQARLSPTESRVVFTASSSWHKGVIGPVAARLAETFRKSAFVVCVEGEVGVGSGRAWRKDNVSELLGEVSDLLLRFGGHSGAAGFSVLTERIPELARRLCALPESSAEVGHQETYFPIEPSQLGEAWKAWGVLDPFGPGNPEPYLGLAGLCAKGQKTLSGGHLSWDVGISPTQTVQFIAWNGENAGLVPASLAPSRTVIGRPAPQQRPGSPPFYFSVAAIL
jgi:single-stranded-DNA-specific exonuclease